MSKAKLAGQGLDIHEFKSHLRELIHLIVFLRSKHVQEMKSFQLKEELDAIYGEMFLAATRALVDENGRPLDRVRHLFEKLVRIWGSQETLVSEEDLIQALRA